MMSLGNLGKKFSVVLGNREILDQDKKNYQIQSNYLVLFL